MQKHVLILTAVAAALVVGRACADPPQAPQPVVAPINHQIGADSPQSAPLGGPRRATPVPPLPGSSIAPPTHVQVPGAAPPAAPGIMPPQSRILIPYPAPGARQPGDERLPTLEPELVAPRGPGVWDLEALSDLALARNPAIREAWAHVRSARGEAVQAGLYPNPTLNGSSPQLAGSDTQYNGFVTQEFVTGGKLRLSRAAAMRAVQQAELQYARRRYDVLTAVRAQFYSAAAAQQRYEVLNSLVAVAHASRESAERLERIGEGARTDSLSLRIEEDRARLALENGETLLQASHQQLAAVVGVPDLAITAVNADLIAPLPDFEYEALRLGVTSRNALAQVARLEISRSRVLLERAAVEPIPNVVAMGGYQRQVGDAPVLDQGLFQVTLPVPLFNRNQGNIAAAQANVTAAAQQYGRVQNELSLRVAEWLAAYRAASQQVERYESDILPRADELLRLAQQGYTAGQFDFLRLLQAQRTLLETRLAYVNAQENRWNSAAQIAGLLQSEQFP